ncbi:pleckstrin homology domain-containing family M member 3 [Amia ocellicauda]|uniref:pleckstrin homology domain-containing family M member 3 n=1 Tax=Amia ocellicauda TaxID=2972642 RepID=UPI003464D7B8
MERREGESVSPALEVTEDFLHCFDGPVENRPPAAPPKGYGAQEDVSRGMLWGLLTKEQLGRGQEGGNSNRLEWADHKGAPSFNIFSMCHGRRSRARSTNDLAAHAKDGGGGGFKRGHSRSRSDANYRSVTDNAALDWSMPGAKDGLGRGESKESSPSLVKKGELEQREGAVGRWSSCHVELTACELRLYGLDGSGNRQLCTAYSLSHCQSVAAPLGPDGRVLQALFFNSTRLQLRAPCQWEALDWRQRLWERVLAVRPVQQGEDPAVAPSAPAPRPPCRPTALPLFTQRCQDVLKAGVLYQLTDLNNWKAFTFVLSKALLQAFPTEGRGPVSEPLLRRALSGCLAVQRDDSEGRTAFQVVFANDVLRLRAETERRAQDWVEALRTAAAAQRADPPGPAPAAGAVVLRGKPNREQRRRRDAQRGQRQSVTSSFLRILTCLAVEKGLTAQSFRCAGCQCAVGLSRGRAKVCCYSGWYYCQSCHQDSLFLIPARLLHNWDTSKHKVSKQAKEFLEFVYEEPLLDVQQLNPCLYGQCDALAAVLRLRQQLQSLRAYLFNCRATVAEDLRRRIFPREYLLQHIHLYSLADLQQVIDGKLAPFLSKVIKFASAHVFGCSLCSQKGFVCELCHSRQVIFPFQDTATKRCEGCGAVFHAECRSRAQPCPRCVRRELHKKPRAFWRGLQPGDGTAAAEDPYSCFELPFQDT